MRLSVYRIQEKPQSSTRKYMDGKKRSDVRPGLRVSIVLKKDQNTGKRSEGIVRNILTNSPSHPHGIKVRLESGEVGRVREIFY